VADVVYRQELVVATGPCHDMLTTHTHSVYILAISITLISVALEN